MKEIKSIRGTHAALTSLNPILLDNQIAFETDTKKWKIGNGILHYNDIPYNYGESAYDIWIRHGHTGSEDDFLESLKGEPGESAYEQAVKGGYWEGTQMSFINKSLMCGAHSFN